MASPKELVELHVERIGAAGDGVARWRASGFIYRSLLLVIAFAR